MGMILSSANFNRLQLHIMLGLGGLAGGGEATAGCSATR